MKTIISSLLVLTVTLTSLSFQPLQAQEAQMHTVDGDALMKKLLSQRYKFNKALIKNGASELENLPKSEAIFNRKHLATVHFNGLDYEIKDNSIVAIKGLNLSQSCLAAITEKLLLLDRTQVYYTEKSNQQYAFSNRDLAYIKTLDRNYFSTLMLLENITAKVAAMANKNDVSTAIEITLSKSKVINLPSDDNKTIIAQIR